VGGAAQGDEVAVADEDDFGGGREGIGGVVSGENGLHVGGAEPGVDSIEQGIAVGPSSSSIVAPTGPSRSPCRMQRCSHTAFAYLPADGNIANPGHLHPHRNCAELSLEYGIPFGICIRQCCGARICGRAKFINFTCL